MERIITPTVDTEGCWLWAGYINEQGYGQFSYYEDGKSKRTGAHRLLYEQMIGEIPKGLVLDHLCRVRHCVNPAHLEPVTNEENIKRGLAGFPKSHCPSGHELTGYNVKLTKAGVRRCRACAAAQQARFYAANYTRWRQYNNLERARRRFVLLMSSIVCYKLS